MFAPIDPEIERAIKRAVEGLAARVRDGELYMRHAREHAGGGKDRLAVASHTEDHDHDGSPTQQLLAANTHGSPSADTHHAKSHAHNGADGSGTVATLRDADADTKVQVEESADEDKVRVDTLGVERLVIDTAFTLVGALARLPLTAKTITTDQISIAANDTAHWTLAGEGGAADDLDGINGGTEGDVLIVSPVSDSVTITLRHNNAGGSIGSRLYCAGAADIVLDDQHDFAILVYKASLLGGFGGWMTGLVAGGGSGAVATDTIWDAAGDLAVGTGADTAARLAISVPAADIVNVPGVVNGETTLSYKSLMDATAPTTQAFGDAAAAGTGVMLARVTHKHAMPADPVTAHAAAADPHTGYVLESLLDAKGDLIAASADNTPAKLTVGSNNKVLIAASGEAAGLKYDYVYHEVTVTVENPTASENIVVRQFTQAVTIDAIQAVVIGGTSVTIDPEHGSTITTATKLLSAAEVVASSSTSGEHIGGTGTAMAASFNDATLAAGDFLRLKTTAISGTPTQLSVTFKYRLT